MSLISISDMTLFIYIPALVEMLMDIRYEQLPLCSLFFGPYQGDSIWSTKLVYQFTSYWLPLSAVSVVIYPLNNIWAL